MSEMAVAECATQVVKVKPLVKAQLKLAKHSPEIMVGVGIVSMVAGTILACRATLKAPQLIEDTKDTFALIKETRDQAEKGVPFLDESGKSCEYTKKDYQQDLVGATFQSGVKFAKLYAVPTILICGGIFAITKGHSITMKRNAALSSALATITAGYREYRARVRERYGEEMERKLFYGIKEETVDVVDEKGKVKKEKVEVITVPNGGSPYNRVFDINSPAWSPSPEMNLTFLRCQQNYANDMLQVQGHVFLNEVYDMLGLPRSEEGAITGWVRDSSLHAGDNFIDFGLPSVPEDLEVPLDFNVDGIIFDLL